jgi:hypothetical protein
MKKRSSLIGLNALLLSTSPFAFAMTAPTAVCFNALRATLHTERETLDAQEKAVIQEISQNPTEAFFRIRQVAKADKKAGRDFKYANVNSSF